MTASTLSDDQLSRAIAEAIGLRLHETSRWGFYAIRGEGEYPWGDWRPLKPYATSLDAISEPEQRLRDAGWQSFHSEIDGITHWGWRKGAELFSADDEKETRARALACLPVLAALKALAEARS